MIGSTLRLNQRVLSMRLEELSRDGYIVPISNESDYPKWELTEKGKDVLQILMANVNSGVKLMEKLSS